MLPTYIMGGMGVYISTPFLANAVSQHEDSLGTVSGTAAYIIMTRILQAGDPGGHYREALSHFPYPDIANEVLKAYFVDGGISAGTPYKQVPVVTLSPSRLTIALIICANFAFVWLAKQGHQNEVSINYLEKVQLPHLYSIYGAMLADVGYVTMGAGIPLQIPDVLDAFANGQAAEYRVSVTGNSAGALTMRFDPNEYFGQPASNLRRPSFLPIVSSDALAALMDKKLRGRIQGFSVERATAGGHNAWPRGPVVLNESHEPIYGERSNVNYQKLTDLGIPWWLAGSSASPQGLAEARAAGAKGIQFGSILALSDSSGMDPLLRQTIIRQWYCGKLRIRTDVLASPTGFPFKVAELDGTVSDIDVYEMRPRICNRHGLSMPHELLNGAIVYRCAAEPLEQYLLKGGKPEDAVGRRCLCNGLITTAGLGDAQEPAIVTLGDDLSFLRHLVHREDGTYTVTEALNYLRQPV